MGRSEKLAAMAKKYAEDSSGDRERLPTLKWKDGETKTIRILPTKSLLKRIVEAEKFVGYDAEIDEDIPLPVRIMENHWINGIRVTCPKKAKSLPCPICEQEEELKDSTDEDDQRTYNNIKVKRQCTYFAIDRAEEDKGPQWIYFAPKWNNLITGILSNPKYGDIDHPGDGRDLDITRTGSGRSDTNYTILPDPQPTYLASKVETDDDGDYDVPDWDTMRKWCEVIVDIHTEYANDLFTYDEIVSLSRGEITVKEIYDRRREGNSDEVPSRQKQTESNPRRRSVQNSRRRREK